MRILYNGLCIAGHLSGVQYYAAHLMHEALFGNAAAGAGTFHAVVNRDYAHMSSFAAPCTEVPVQGRAGRIAYEHLRLPRLFADGGFDLLHCPAYILPWGFRGRSVLTVHDLIALQYPHYCKRLSSLYFGMSLGRSIRRADRIIAVSQRVREDILGRFPVAPEKISVIHLGVDPMFRPVDDPLRCGAVRRRYGLPDRFLLFVGNIEPKKNLERLLEAFLQFTRRNVSDHKLVIAGQFAWRYDGVIRTLNRLKLTDRVMLLGYVPREELPALYSLADLFVFPSLYEGFGLPPLEAAACGAPVLVSHAGALPEIAGEYARYVDPFSVEDMADGIDKALADGTWRELCRETGPARAASFSWQRTWTETQAVYQSLM